MSILSIFLMFACYYFFVKVQHDCTRKSEHDFAMAIQVLIVLVVGMIIGTFCKQ